MTSEMRQGRDRPMIFSAPMIKALLAGRKAQTRRLVDPLPAGTPLGVGSTLVCSGGGFVREVVGHFRPRWRRGDRLWVKETTRRAPDLWTYEADGSEVPWPGRQSMASWTRDTGAAMYLPRAASRLTLIVENVRVERLKDISEEDARAEGIGEPYLGDADPPWEEVAVMVSRKMQFRNLWKQIHGEGAWDANPWVAALTFRVIPQNIDRLAVTPSPRGEDAAPDPSLTSSTEHQP